MHAVCVLNPKVPPLPLSLQPLSEETWSPAVFKIPLKQAKGHHLYQPYIVQWVMKRVQWISMSRIKKPHQHQALRLISRDPIQIIMIK